MGRKCLMLLLMAAVAVGGCWTAGVESADRLNTYELLKAAAAANSAGRVEDAAYLFFAGQARYQIDKQVFPPMKTGADSPGVLKASLEASVEGPVSKALAGDPAAMKNVAARLAKWSPKFDRGYDPGWLYSNGLRGAAVDPIVTATQQKMLSALEAKAKLLDNSEYRQLAARVAAATKIESQYWAAVKEKQSANAVADDLKKQFAEAQQQRAIAAKRMKEIELATNPDARWYARVGWKAEDYFDDKQVVALCTAIEDDNVPEMERLIAAGTNANAVGKDGMTPLLWAFPDRKVARFECLLKHGADPNVIIQSDFKTGARPFHPYPVGGSAFTDRGCHPGQSVTLLAARSPLVEYLKLVMEHGGDANIVDGKTGEAPLDVVLDRSLSASVMERVGLLVAKGANVNRYCDFRNAYPAMAAVKIEHYDAALALLKAGADPALYQPDGTWKLTGFLVNDELNRERQEKEGVQLPKPTPEYRALIAWLEQHGESLEAARQERTALDARYKDAHEPRAIGEVTQEIISERRAREGKK